MAYILGKKGFMDYEFKVTKDTLIPRPETELLVENLIRLNKEKGPRRILDIGCGSGAVIDSLLGELPEATGMAVDISSGAVAVTRENAEAIGVADRLETVVSDLFANVPKEPKFQVVVSNPPYIPEGDLAGLQPEVQQEPRSALDGGKDGLDFYRRILENIWQVLDPKGRKAGFDCVKVCRDYGDVERMVFAGKGDSDYGHEILEIKER